MKNTSSLLIDSTGVAIMYSDYADAQKILNVSEGKGFTEVFIYQCNEGLNGKHLRIVNT